VYVTYLGFAARVRGACGYKAAAGWVRVGLVQGWARPDPAGNSGRRCFAGDRRAAPPIPGMFKGPGGDLGGARGEL